MMGRTGPRLPTIRKVLWALDHNDRELAEEEARLVELLESIRSERAQIAMRLESLSVHADDDAP